MATIRNMFFVTFLVILGVLSPSLRLDAQTTYFSDRTVWTSNHMSNWGNYFQRTSMVCGDTIVNGKEYQKIYNYSGYNPSDYVASGPQLIRQEGQKVFMGTDDVLLYDFGLSVGDVFTLDIGVFEFSIYVSFIDTINVLGVDRRALHFGQETWYEGVGSDLGFFLRGNHNAESYDTLCSMHINGVPYFADPIAECNPFNFNPLTDLPSRIALQVQASGFTDTLRLSKFLFECGEIENINHVETRYSCADIGTEIEMPVEFTDSNGTLHLDTVAIYVTDRIAPTINCLADITLDACEAIAPLPPSFSDNCNASLEQIAGPASGASLKDGAHLFTFRATDQSGNRQTCSYTITVASQLNTTAILDQPLSCHRDTDACVSFISSGGMTPYAIDFLDPNITNCSSLGAGIWSYQVTDGAGCTFIDSVTIDAPPDLIIAGIANLTHSNTSNSNDGSIDILISGGTAPYQFEWYLNGAVVSILEDPLDLVAGTYTCIVTDSKGCTFTSVEWEITAITSVEAEPAFAEYLSIYPNPNSGKVWVNLEQVSELISEILRVTTVNGSVIRKLIID